MTNLVILERISEVGIVAFQQKFDRIPQLKYRNLGPLPADYTPIFRIDHLALVNSNMQSEHWIMITNSVANCFCRLFWWWNVQSSQAAVQADNAMITTVPFQCSLFPRDKFKFSSLDFLERRNYRSSRC